MADTIMRDLSEMPCARGSTVQALEIAIDDVRDAPVAWVFRQPSDSGSWGLIQCNPGDNWIGTANPKFFAMC